MTFFDKIKDLGSKIVKPVVKTPWSSKIPRDLMSLRGGKDVPTPTYVHGGHSFTNPNGTTGWVSYK